MSRLIIRGNNLNKRIGILTLSGKRNYGNVLQNYALQTFFQNQGYDVKTFWYQTGGDRKGFKEKILAHVQKKDFFETLVYQFLIRTNKRYKDKELLLSQREKVFSQFLKKYINYSKLELTKTFSKEVDKNYDAIFVGSDQVWGLNGNNVPSMYFLPFVNSHKRNSFAASFGFSNLPSQSLKDGYKSGLNGMNSISVRENEGKELIKKISGRKSTILLDPTFLLSADQWLAFTEESKLLPTKSFLLTYFLGKKSAKEKEYINSISEYYNLDVIDLNDLNNNSFYTVSPQNFIRLFADASFVVTDSFHGTAFSLIFEKPFIVLDRLGSKISMNSRIVTLLKRMHLSNRFITNMNDDVMSLLSNRPDFSIKRREVQKNMNESKLFINKALK